MLKKYITLNQNHKRRLNKLKEYDSQPKIKLYRSNSLNIIEQRKSKLDCVDKHKEAIPQTPLNKTKAYKRINPMKNSIRNDFSLEQPNNINITEDNLQTIAEKIYLANKEKIEQNKIKDEEINKINDKIREKMITNFDLQRKIQNLLTQRDNYEIEQKKIAKYCNDIAYKYRHMEETVKAYKKEVTTLKNIYKRLNEQYDNKINNIEQENKKILNRINNRIELFVHNKNEIEEKKIKVKLMKNDNMVQKKLIEERIMKNQKKFAELQKKYEDILHRVCELEYGNDVNKSSNNGSRKVGKIKSFSPEIRQQMKIEEITKKIKIREKENLELIDEINELDSEYKKMKSEGKINLNISVGPTIGGSTTFYSNNKFPYSTNNIHSTNSFNFSTNFNGHKK